MGILGRLGLAAVILGTLVWTGAPRADADDTVAKEIAAAARFRAEMAFAADTDLLIRMQSDLNANRTWAVPLRKVEAAAVSRRAALPEQATDALTWAESQASYAGSFIDHAAGGVLVVQFADPDLADDVAAVLALSDASAIDVRQAARSIADLERLRVSVHDSRDWFAAIGAELISTGIDTRNNVLLIGVRGMTSDVEAAVMAQFGGGVSVRDDDYSVADACTVNSCWPQKGGIKLFPVSNSARKCTSGFTVRYGSPVQYGLLTAGHCVVLGGTGNYAHQSDHIVGKPTPHTYHANAHADAVVIKMSSSAPPSSGLNYWVWEDNDTNAVSRVAPHSEQVQGAPVCMQGWGTRNDDPDTKGRQCGTITVPHTERPSCLDTAKTNCVMMQDMYEMSFDTHPGDSGGPVSTGCCTAVGLVTDSEKDGENANRSWYSTIVWSISEIDNVSGGVRWRVCLNSTCTSYW